MQLVKTQGNSPAPPPRPVKRPAWVSSSAGTDVPQTSTQEGRDIKRRRMYPHDRERKNEESLQKSKTNLRLGQEQTAHSSLCLGTKSPVATVGLGTEISVWLLNECAVPQRH